MNTTVVTDKGRQLVQERINKALTEFISSTPQSVAGENEVDCWQPSIWNVKAKPRRALLTFIGDKGQEKEFRFRSLRLARVHAKRNFKSLMFADMTLYPLAPVRFIQVGFQLQPAESGEQ